ncbi:MAG: CDP-diacylglycerol--glycerol-3-phosphate 3-phosphatidyltransferase [Candidatus Lightella neohaematopini]|nr:CDP-diacylglycerol--glycerol-3-phosphate 3-phosphatidyltransferase [Candidatus Lightella neohaematopini]
MQFNIPTWLTVFRVVVTPLFIFVFYLPFNWSRLFCIVIFIVASITDWFDGFLARRWKQTSNFGAFLDPVADKVMVSVVLVLISDQLHYWLITLPSSIIIAREIIISALREWLARLGKNNNISVTVISKIKTTIQIIAITTLLYQSDNYIILIIGIIFLYIALILTFYSMLKYLYIIRHEFYKKL